MKDKTNIIEEAYKKLDGTPAGDAVSKAAKGEDPETDMEDREEDQEQQVQRMYGEPDEIENAYAKLFDALADIMRCK